ncbi:helix-turn-helix domain-containing protein [Allokutzneria sp. A3M-2-11 16]|uniref:excisionase family DNA-binding protein n=1 Tax=Allokutzneria sp. A3M-2-11 16 TaxID=2962043 RepID=UPI0020B7B5D9|nr:helix-turn-helix domain-containing protein [Allokutzneria sp. A3M-2-11 16]MCP3799329.1 helix-turn-helix domain-containing protein [Allokutzneria sp. A3M-2-11 16]
MTLMLEEMPPPASPAELDAARSLAETVAGSAVELVVREADGTEHVLSAAEARIWLLLLQARARGQKVILFGEDEQISPRQAAELLGISRPMVYRLIDRGDLTAIQVGSHRRLRAVDVVDLARSRAAAAAVVDAGFAAALRTGHATGESTKADADAKAAWREADGEERAAATERTAKRIARRRGQ